MCASKYRQNFEPKIINFTFVILIELCIEFRKILHAPRDQGRLNH